MRKPRRIIVASDLPDPPILSEDDLKKIDEEATANRNMLKAGPPLLRMDLNFK